jgi:Asp-tRNA(Asn)/Glu-tRNA(Gln) amidotransferase A subunit family amidase
MWWEREKKKQGSAGTNAGGRSGALDRRKFLKLFPAAGVARLAAGPAEIPSGSAEPAQKQAAQQVTKEALHAAQQLIGIQLTEAQQTMALTGVIRNRASYQALREVEIPLDIDVPFAFRPALSGKRPGSHRAKPRSSNEEIPNFSSIEELAFFTVSDLAKLIRARRVSPVELTKMYLSRLKRYGPKLNCIVTLTEELALRQAEAAEREIRNGRYRGPLHGIPWGAKDLFASKGIPTTWGARIYSSRVIDYDAAVIERLRDAGAVLVAKLSMGELAKGARWFGGVTRNPWQVDETEQGSGGSSAGPAAATAAGLVGFSVGTETLGSIISPSSRCGVVGLRPTYGRVSRYGAMCLSYTMDKVGPIARGVEDCAAVLAAICGPDGRDITVEDVPFNWPADARIEEMRIGYLKDEFELRDAKMKQIYDEALDVLRRTGARLEPIQLPKYSAASSMIILSAETGAAFDELTRSDDINQLSGQGRTDWPNIFRTSRFIPAVEYFRAQRVRTLLMREMDKLMSSWDVFVSPAPASSSLLVTNLTGHPAVCVPCGFNKGLPCSIMFTGGLFDEAAALRVALAFEGATRWHTLYPKMDWA